MNGKSSAACGIEASESVVGNSRAPAYEGSPSFEVRGNCDKWSQRLAGIGLTGLLGKRVQSSRRDTGEGFRRNRRLLIQGPALLSGRAGV
jgi:hypothetical protein